MSVELGYVFRSSECGEIGVAVARRPSSGLWVVVMGDDFPDELEQEESRMYAELLSAAASKCEELNREAKS